MITIRFSGRTPNPKKMSIGMGTASRAETRRLVMPKITDGCVENGTDLNTITASGVYLLGANGDYGNAPSGLSYGFLTVKTVNAITCQTVETPSGNFTRFYDGSTWGAWQ